MKVYPDTSFLCSLYRQQKFSQRADAFRKGMSGPLPFTRLLEFEFLQAIRLQVWLHANDRSKGYSQREADQMITDWESDVGAGLNVLIAADADLVLRLAREFSSQRTTIGGHRTLDILHVATAVHLQAETFLTFDSRQRQLAEAIGLRVPCWGKI